MIILCGKSIVDMMKLMTLQTKHLLCLSSSQSLILEDIHFFLNNLNSQKTPLHRNKQYQTIKIRLSTSRWMEQRIKDIKWICECSANLMHHLLALDIVIKFFILGISQNSFAKFDQGVYILTRKWQILWLVF